MNRLTAPRSGSAVATSSSKSKTSGPPANAEPVIRISPASTVNARRLIRGPPRGSPPSTALAPSRRRPETLGERSEEHTSELQSQFHLVCRLLLEKKKKKKII